MTTRIYLVSSRDNTERHLVRAALPAQAERHVSRQRYAARLPTQDELLELAGTGMKVQTAADGDGDDTANGGMKLATGRYDADPAADRH